MFAKRETFGDGKPAMHPRTRKNFSSLQRLSLIVFVCAALFGSGAQTASAQAQPELTAVSQVRALLPEQAQRALPVRLRGVVTVVSGWKSSFFFQDSTSGISIDRPDDSAPLEPGQLVEVLGVTGPGKFAPLIKAKTVTVLGKGKLPSARLVGPTELSGGALDSQWAAIQGVVRTATIKPIWGRDVLVLELDIGGGTLVVARVRDFAKDAWRRLPASIVTLRGVCGTTFNDRRQYIASRFFVSSLDDVKVVRQGPKDLFDRPLTPLDGIARFSTGKNAWTPVKVKGTVTYRQADDKIYVQDGAEGVLAQTTQGAAIGLNSEVEIVGYARYSDYSPALEGAALRVVSEHAKPTKPVSVNVSDMIVEKDGFSSSPYDSLLVRLKGTLIQVIPGPDDIGLYIRDGKNTFTARLANTAATHGIPALGSVVEVTGICVTRVDNAREPRGFRLLLRSVSDISVLKDAPWWSAEHAKMVVLIMGIAMAAMAGLLWLFRRDAALRQLSLSDPLTGVHNRRGFVLLAEQQRRIAARNKKSLLMFYIDLDRFKEINDTLGHKQGDIALQMVADILRECFRKSDVIGRLGGDEFAIIACDAASNSKAELEERLMGLVEQSNQKLAGAFEISLSVGALLCDASMDGLSIEELMSQADTLMYEQKTVRRSAARASAQIPAAV